MNFSPITGESESYKGFLPGIVLGGRMNITRPDRKIVADAGLLFSMEGSKYEEYEYEPGGGGGTSSASLRLNYFKSSHHRQIQGNINKGFFCGSRNTARLFTYGKR